MTKENEKVPCVKEGEVIVQNEIEVSAIKQMSEQDIARLTTNEIEKFTNQHFEALKNRKKVLANEEILASWLKNRVFDTSIDDDLAENSENDLPKYILKKNNGGYVINKTLLAEVLMGKYSWIIISDELYMYIDGYYQVIPENYVNSYIKEEIPAEYDLFNTTLQREVKNMIFSDKRILAPFSNQDFSEISTRYTNCKNGVFDWYECKFVPHNKDIITFSQIKGSYRPNENLSSYYIDNLISFNFPNKETQKTLWQIVATGYRPFVIKNGHLFMVGKSDGGKSTLLEALFLPIPDEGKSSIGFGRLTKKNSTEWLTLRGKTVNVIGETTIEKAEALEDLKDATSGMPFQTRLLYKNGEKYTNQATLIFGSNTEPNFDEASLAFTNRFNFFLVDKFLPIELQDPNLLTKVEFLETDYIVTRAITEMLEIMHNGNKIFISDEVRKWNAQFSKTSDSVAQFFEDCCISKVEDGYEPFTLPNIFYDVYKQYCQNELGLQPKMKKDVMAVLKSKFNLKVGEPRIPGTKTRAIEGAMVSLEKLKEYEWFERLPASLISKINSSNNAKYIKKKDHNK